MKSLFMLPIFIFALFVSFITFPRLYCDALVVTAYFLYWHSADSGGNLTRGLTASLTKKKIMHQLISNNLTVHQFKKIILCKILLFK